MEFTRDEIARLLAVLQNDIDMQKIMQENYCFIDFLTPTFTLYSNLSKAYYEGDKILHIGIKD